MLSTAQENLKQSRTDLQRELEAAGAKFKGKSCRCIFHDDREPSAGIFEKAGHWYFKCFGCGVAFDIFSLRAHLNKTTVGDELRKVGGEAWLKNAEPQKRVFKSVEEMVATINGVEAVYKYTHPDSGRIELVAIRFRPNPGGKKQFIQASATPGGFWMEAPIGPTPLYNRQRVRGAQTVIVVEGEKCVHALHEVGIVAVSSAAGAMNGDKADWQPLAGKTAILWPDMDEPEDDYPRGKGVWHMERVAKILMTLTPRATVLWFNPDGLELPEKGDAADLVARYRKEFTVEQTHALIEDILADAEPMGVVGEYAKELEATIAGERRSIAFPWPHLTDGARALIPGKTLCVCGDGGCGKSLWILHCLCFWLMSAVRACIYQLEDDRNYHLRRIHAQLEGNAKLTDNAWVEQNPEHVRESMKQNAESIEAIGRAMWEAPDEQISLEMLTVWVEERAKAGFEVIVIDPITAAQSENRPWISDLKFITKCKTVARRYGSRVIFITHPRSGVKGGGKATHNDMAGGAAYPRFAHSVFWIERNDAENEYTVRDKFGNPEFHRPNRVLSISKARNGPLAGRRIAFNFDGASLLYHELGLIEKSA